MYGLLLLAASPGATAVDGLADIGKYRTAQAAASAAPRRSLATIQGLVVLRTAAGTLTAESLDEPLPQLALEAVTAQIHTGGAGSRVERAPHFLIPATESRKAGEDSEFDLAVSDFGTFHLQLALRRDPAQSAWSLGGTIGLDRTTDRRVAAVPEVRVQGLHRNETRYLPFEASLKQAIAAREDSPLAFRWRV